MNTPLPTLDIYPQIAARRFHFGLCTVLAILMASILVLLINTLGGLSIALGEWLIWLLIGVTLLFVYGANMHRRNMSRTDPSLSLSAKGFRICPSSFGASPSQEFNWNEVRRIGLHQLKYGAILGIHLTPDAARRLDRQPSRFVQFLNFFDKMITGWDANCMVKLAPLDYKYRAKDMAMEMVKRAEAAGVEGYHDNKIRLKRIKNFDWRVKS